jgi:hypothetical protein
MFCLNYSLYHDEESKPFHFHNDFSGYLQIDKLQHTFGSYIESYIGYQYLKNAGVKKNSALLYGGSLGFILQSPKEIIDGFYKSGFSWGDIVANASGSALLISQQILFDEQILKYKFSFSRSEYAHQANGYLGKTVLQNYFDDYNGHTYWLSINVSKIFPKMKLPDWISIAAGYSANGMFGIFENINSYRGVIIPETQRYRQYLLSLDVDWTKINTRSKFLRTLFQGLNFIKIPFPAIEINSMGRLKGYWIYF